MPDCAGNVIDGFLLHDECHKRGPTMNEASILAAALERLPAERAAFLDDACAGSLRLRRRVEALLKVHDEPDEVLDVPGERNPTLLKDPVTEQPGMMIGPYKLM
jgi:hypothetical protein